MSKNHPVYTARKQCTLCKLYMDGSLVNPKAEGAKAVVLYLCAQCDRTR